MRPPAALGRPGRSASLRRWTRCALAAVLGLAASAAPAAAILTGLPSGFVDELVVGGLPFPTAVAFTGDGRMLVALKRGDVLIYEGTTLLGTFVDIEDRVHDNHDRGLLGVAAHPDFPDTPYVYLLYTHDPPGVYPDRVDPSAPGTTSVSARVAQLLRVEADPATGYTTAKPGSEVVLLGTNSTRANIGSENHGRNTAFASCMSPANMSGTPVEDCLPSDEDSHTIGSVVFAPDGSLFVSSGDGSNYGSVDLRALRSLHLDSLAGKILRIDPLTGAGLPDNPFFDLAEPNRNRSKLWSYGVRNPFRIAIHPATGEPFIGDVGWNSWEEIDTGKGANFGWPCYEGGAVSPPESGVTTSRQQSGYRSNAVTAPLCQALYDEGLGAVKAPTFSYDHSGGGSSANGGAFYAGGPYPPEYDGALFVTDYNRRWIRYLTFDTQGTATVHSFGSADSGPVQLVVGPDSNLYWMKFGATGGELRRVRYTGAGNTPPVVILSATPTIGVAPLSVSFDSSASYDPDAQALDYDWAFGDGASSSQPNPSHVYQDAGVYDAVLTLTEQTAPFAEGSETVRITVGTSPPLATILAPEDGDSYRVGDVIAFAASATSGSDPVPAGQLAWELRTVHNQHLHYDALPSAPDPVDPFLSVGSFGADDHGDDVRFQLCVTATVGPEPVIDTRCIDLFPETTEITLATDPIGLQISYEDEGIELSGPALIHPVVNSEQTISVLRVQQHRTFTRWADGPTSRSRSFTVGTEPETFTAIFENLSPTAVIAPGAASGPAPLEVSFAGGASSDPEGDTLEYAWDAGAAGTSSAAAPSFGFPFGEHLVTLTVTDQLGATGSDQVVVSALASCGNGEREADEACDDGDLVSGDGCDANCTETACGNGVVTAGELCDDGNDVAGDGCDPNCTLTGCGNGVQAGGEECDDGDLVSGDGCDANCRETGCGNGLQTAGELCDDGNHASGDGCDADCTPTGCGNGIATPGEACDDGNEVSDDGCDATCRENYGPQTRAQIACIEEVNRGVARVARAGQKAAERCLAAAAAGRLAAGPTAFDDCLEADTRGTVDRARRKLEKRESEGCQVSEPPELALGDDRLAGSLAASVLPAGLARDLFGEPPAAAAKADRRGSRCQAALLRQANRLLGSIWAEIPAAKAGALEGRAADPTVNDGELSELVSETLRVSTRIDRVAAKLQRRVGSACADTDAGMAAPGCQPADAAALSACAERSARCRACSLLLEADPRLLVDCDLFDDGLADATCTPVL